MLEWNGKIQIEIQDKLLYILSERSRDPEISFNMAKYLYENISLLDRLTEGFRIWLKKETSEIIDTHSFFLGALRIFHLLKQNMDENSSWADIYIESISISDRKEYKNYQSWNFNPDIDTIEPIRGIYQALIGAGLSRDYIDQYYLDGHLLEFYENCQRILIAMEMLTETENPSPMDTCQGLIHIENSFRKIYSLCFMESLEGLWGLEGILYDAVARLKV